MAVNFATPIAHQSSANYTAFNNAIAVGRSYRQSLQTAPNPANFAPGLELFLSSTGDVAMIFSWLDGVLTWQASSVAQPGNRLILTTEPRILAGDANLPSLNFVETLPQKAIYENIDQAAVQTALETLLNTAYAAAVADPSHPNNWHPVMRMVVLELPAGNVGPNRKLKEYIDGHAPTATTITNLVTGFLTGGAGGVVNKIMVRAGDAIGRAAPYLVTDPLPAAPPFALGGVADPNRARRLTFQTWDNNEQPINPLYYLHIFMRRMLLPPAGRIVNSLTNIIAGGVLTHPLVTLFPSLSAVAVPRAREQVNAISRFPLSDLNNFHGYPLSAPVSKLEWHYTNVSVFEVRPHVAGTAVPSMTPNAQRTNRVTNLWTTHGVTIAAISDALQIPQEVIFGLIGAEAPGAPGNPNQFDERAVRLEPLLPINRNALRAADVAAVLELEYDHVIGIQGNVTNVVLNPNGTSRLDITLTANRRWAKDFLRRSGFFALVADTDRLRVTANNDGSSAPTTNYQITVEDFRFNGGFANGSTQGSGNTLYYLPSTRAAGNATEPPAGQAVGRDGTLRRLQVHATQNTLNGPTTITIYKNGVATVLTVTLAAGTKNGSDNVTTVAVATGDNISVEVVTGGTTGRIKNLTFTFQNAPTTGDVWVLEGFSTSVPDPWNGAGTVRAGRTLTWDQLVDVVNGTNGARISPGVIQTLITTARGVLPWLNALQPNIFTATGIPAPPANAGGFLNDWLLHAPRSILVGAAYIRQGYNKQATRFDLPIVGSAYNHGHPQQDVTSIWGLHYFGTYVENAGPTSNAAANLFNNPATTPASTVRFML
jgi:hypothetical protein